MPYFVLRMRPPAPPEALAAFDSFPEASREAKALRVAAGAQPQRRVRVVFADNELAAQDLLQQVREAPPGGDDD